MLGFILVTVEDLVERGGNFQECLQHVRVEMLGHCSSISVRYDPAGGLMVKGRFVGAFAAQGIILVYQHHDPAFDGYFLALEPPGISLAIEPFVVRERDRRGDLDPGVG